jgi:hypothetical protein
MIQEFKFNCNLFGERFDVKYLAEFDYTDTTHDVKKTSLKAIAPMYSSTNVLWHLNQAADVLNEAKRIIHERVQHDVILFITKKVHFQEQVSVYTNKALLGWGEDSSITEQNFKKNNP